MPTLTITSDQIIGGLTLIGLLWATYKIIKEAKKPSDDLKAEVSRHDELLDSDNKRLKEMESSNRMILQCLLVIINHDVTGNGIAKMKEIRDNLQEYLINK